jgi:predicted component of type VI protein secretion system
VEVKPLEGEQRAIPKEQLSILGRKENFARIGKDFALGKTVFSRPERYEILVGPISRDTLEGFRKEGWAEGSHPARKLERLAELAEPYYLRARIRFLLESTSSGFVLAQGRLGTGALGSA